MVDNKKIVLHVGCGPINELTLHNHFKGDEWREIRLDIDSEVHPEIVASLTDMRVVPSNSVDAVWSSHNLEHLFPHQVPLALSEFVRVLKPGGFALITLPDLQTAAELVVADELDGVAYISPGGPITPHDMIYGVLAETAISGDFACHRSGFTAKKLYWALIMAGFAEVLVQRDRYFLWATAYKQRPQEPKALSGVDADPYVPSQTDQVATGYRVWQEQHRLTPEHKVLCNQRARAWSHSPRIHLALLMSEPNDGMLAATIDSLAGQYHMPSRVTVVAPFAPSAEWRNNERLCWHVARGELAQEANEVLAEFAADWVGYVDVGDRLAPHALFSLAEAAVSHPDWRLIYSDEDRINNVGVCDLPHFKPDANLALLRSYPYIGGLMFIEASLFKNLGGFDPGFSGVEEYDLALRVFEQLGTKAIGHVPDVLYHRLTDGGHCKLPVSELIERGRSAVSAHIERLGIDAKVTHGIFPASYRVHYRVGQEVSASVLVVADSDLAHLQRCVESVLEQTAWPNYELVLLADAHAPDDVRAYVDALGSLGEPRIRAVLLTEMLAWADLRNRLAAEARGEYLVFLQAACAVIQAEWLEELLALVTQPGVVAVGPRLLQSDGKVYQSGAVLGLNNQPASTVFADAALDYPGYYGRALLAQNFSVLPEACLVLQHEAFSSAGKFDSAFEGDIAAADLCLRLTQQGGRLEWTPFVSLLYIGDSNNGRASASWDDFYTRWLPRMARDPAYNPNLSLRHDFVVETVAPLSCDSYPWNPLPKVLINPADSDGCGEYRILSPARALNQAMKIQAMTSRVIMSPPEMKRVDPDVIVLQRQVYEHQIEAIKRYKRYGQAFLVFELDDLITNLPLKNVMRPFMPEDVGDWLAEALKLCDRFIVSTQSMAEAYRHLHSDIRVVPNYLETSRWTGHGPARGTSHKPRVGWVGSISHTGDLEIIIEVVRALADEVEWVFFGMCIDEIRPYVHEFHAGVELDQYPAKLASLNLDLALAPLELHPFNECKSHLKLLEYGVLGYPVIATDIRPYQGDYPITRVQNRTEDWIEAIREHVGNPMQCAQRGDALQEYVLSNWMLEDHLDVWYAAWLNR